MVKSFQGVKVVESKTLTQPVLVKDHMSTKLVTFGPDDTIDQVMEALTKRKISGAPVVDASGSLIGIISEVDCLREIIKGKYTNTVRFPAKVSELMTRDVITLSPNMSIFDAALFSGGKIEPSQEKDDRHPPPQIKATGFFC